MANIISQLKVLNMIEYVISTCAVWGIRFCAYLGTM